MVNMRVKKHARITAVEHGEKSDTAAEFVEQITTSWCGAVEIGNTKHVSHLPPSWGTLHALTSFPDDALEGLLADDTINPEIQRSEVRT